MMKNFGTVWMLDVPDDGQFQQAVDQSVQVVGRKMGYGAPTAAYFDIDVQFLACSSHGDVYMVHFEDKATGNTASVRLTQLCVLMDDGRQRALGTRVAVFRDGPART